MWGLVTSALSSLSPGRGCRLAAGEGAAGEVSAAWRPAPERGALAAGYTAPERLAIFGISAGGLLEGAVTNMRPDLFAGVLAHVPFVDVVSTMLDESIPLTAIEWEEWGDPRQPEPFATMLACSPYDRVSAQDYPAMLVTSGLNDRRVQHWEPTKWVAKLRATGTGEAPLLLMTHMGAGHAGSSGRYCHLEDRALDYAFVFDVLGGE